jgi:hypothetical protein
VKKKAFLSTSIILVFLFSAGAGAFYVKSTQANPNPFRSVYDFTEVGPPPGTQPPIIIIYTPQNGSSYPKNFNLTFDVEIPETQGANSISVVSKLYYNGSWDPNEIAVTQRAFGDNASFSIDLSDIPEGNHSLTVYAEGYGSYEVDQEFVDEMTILYYVRTFHKTGFATVSFTKDLVSPSISFLSPPNGTYVSSNVELDFTVSEATSEILYCLDGKANQTVTGSVTLTGLESGVHNMTLYAADLTGNMGVSETVWFSVAEPFPVVPVAAASVAAVAIIGVGLLVYLRRRNHGAERLVKRS